MSLSASALKYSLVGVVATLLHIIVATFLIESNYLMPAGANSVAFVFANIASYTGNTKWSFSSRVGVITWYRFIIVSVLAWLSTYLLASAVDKMGGHYLLGIALVVCIVPSLTFVAHRMFTYR